MQLPIRVSAALTLSFLALGTVASAQNQYVILYPGASNPSTVLQAYLPTSGGILTKASINTLPPGTFQILAMPDGSKYYLISNGGAAVSTLDPSFSVVTPIATSLSNSPSVAMLTPDGRRLLVGAGNILYAIDTASDTVIAQAGLSVTGKITDIAVNLDSTRAFVLSQGAVGPSGTVLTAVDLTAAVPAVVGTPLTLNGDSASPATGITIAPSGFLYLSNNYRIFEINPITLTVTTNGEIPVQAYPGKPFITADGKYLVAANLRPVQGGTLFIQVALATKAAAGFNYTGDILSQFANQAPDIKGNTRLYAVSVSGNLYDISLGSAGTGSCGTLPCADKSQLNNLFPNAMTFTGVQFSNENPPRLMWATYSNGTGNFLIQADLTNMTYTQIPIPATSQKLGTLGTNPLSGGTNIVPFNNNQTLIAGQKSPLPIVAQLVDPLGRGIFRGQITFTSATPGVVIQTPTFVTNSGGYAQTYVTAPATSGAFTVTANGGPGVTPIDFTFNVPGSNGGGGPGGGSLAGLFYISGNGQVLKESLLMTVPLQVQELDASGKPVSGAVITWTTDATAGSIQVSTTTDTTGIARVAFPGATGVSQSGLPTLSTNVTATDQAGNTVNFIYTTIAIMNQAGAQAPDPTVTEYTLDQNGTPVYEFPNGRVINATAGSIVKNAYHVRLQITSGVLQGQGIPNVSVCFTNNDPNGIDESVGTAVTTVPTCGRLSTRPGPSADCIGNPLSDSSGLVTCDLKVGNVIGSTRIFPIVGELQNLTGITLNVTAGPPGVITVVSGDKQTGKPGVQLPTPLAVRVTDAGGNVLTGVPVSWSVILGTGVKLSATTSNTNTNGVASINVTLPPNAGAIKVQANISSTIFVQFNLGVDAQVGSLTPLAGDNQSTFTNTAFSSPLVVLVKDQQGIPLANQQVTFAAVGAGTVSPATVITGIDGTASTKVTAGGALGPVSVTAIAGTFQTSFNNLTVIQAGPQVSTNSFLNAASLQPGLTPCGLGIITGTGIATGVSGTLAPTGFGPNPTTLGPVQSLTIGGFAAPLTSVSNINGVERVGFQTPCEVPVGSATVVMNVNGGTTTVNSVPVSAYLPGMFETLASDGLSYAVALRPDGSFIGPSNPALRGEVIRVFVTGLGQTTPPIGTNKAGTGGQSVNAQLVGGVNNGGVLVVKAEYVAGQIGTYFVDLQIPLDTVTGPYQPIAVAVQPPGGGDLIFGNGVYIPIQ